MTHPGKRKGFQIHSPTKRRRCAAFMALALGLAWLPGTWRLPVADSLSEAQVKAAYLYNFAKFVEWPAEDEPDNSDISLCVIGNNPLEGFLETLNGRNIGERRLRLVRHNYANLSLSGCHLLYIGLSEQAHFLVILNALGNAPTLTLSDIENFAEKGGGIGLVVRNNKVVFEVNLETIRKAGLHLPGQLLNIATHVYGR